MSDRVDLFVNAATFGLTDVCRCGLRHRVRVRVSRVRVCRCDKLKHALLSRDENGHVHVQDDARESECFRAAPGLRHVINV